MRRTPKLLLAISLLLAVTPFGQAEDKAKDKADEGWVSLFNGKDLTGWKISEKGDWKVVDGAIVTPPQRSHLFTEMEFKNFEFKAEVMTEPGSNSGIYIHTAYEETFPTHGYECQVNCTHGDVRKNGSLWGVTHSLVPNAKDNEWYTIEISVKGKSVQTKVNGKVVIDYIEPEGLTIPRRLGKGSFALQGHDPKSVVRFRNLKVKPLAD